jgi:hypothetical protein
MKFSNLLIITISSIFIAVFSILILSENRVSYIIIFLIGIITFLPITLFKIITIGQLSVENNMIIKKIGRTFYCLNINSKIKIKYGIFLLKIYNDNSVLYLEKNEMTYRLMMQIYDIVKRTIDDIDDLKEVPSYEYKVNNTFLLIPYLFLILPGLLMYIYLGFLFFIVVSLVMSLILFIVLFCNKKIIISGDEIIINFLKKNKVYNINLVKNIRAEVSEFDFKLYLHFFLNKNISISTIGRKADFYTLKKIFNIYNILYENVLNSQR